MKLFNKKNKDIPHISLEQSVPVLRCSICTGEQVLCSKDRKTGQLTELMLIRKPSDLFDFCNANGISAEDVQKIY
ncbi:MAG: aspartate dehydrogenase [Clostridiales bacterium]|nr:aspartate dehydrogenase [Clostridiales bacterium]